MVRGRGRGWIPTSTRGGPSRGGRPIVSAVATRVAALLLVTPPTANAQLLQEPREGIQQTSHTKSWQLGQNTNRLRSAVAGRRPQRSQVRRDAEAGTALGERSRRVWHPPSAPTMLGPGRFGICRPVPAPRSVAGGRRAELRGGRVHGLDDGGDIGIGERRVDRDGDDLIGQALGDRAARAVAVAERR